MVKQNLKDPLPVDPAAEEQPEVSESSSESEEESVVLLESHNRNLFLTKVGIAFLLYSLAAFCTAVFILIDIRRSTIAYRQFSLQTILWMFLGISAAIKLAFGFFGHHFRVLAKLVFPIDLAATVFFTLGLYYYLESYKTADYYSYAPFVIIACVNLFVSAFFFTLVTLYHSRSKQFNYLIGTTVMTLFNVGAIVALAYGWQVAVTITVTQYVIVGVLCLLLNFYICVNAYYVVNIRVEKFKETDAVWAFYCFWTDIFFEFWRNVFSNTARVIRQKQRLRKKRMSMRKAQAAKAAAQPGAPKKPAQACPSDVVTIPDDKPAATRPSKAQARASDASPARPPVKSSKKKPANVDIKIA